MLRNKHCAIVKKVHLEQKKIQAVVFVSLIALTPLEAQAYLDPGTGSMLLSVLVGAVSSAYFLIRRLPGMVRAAYFRLAGKKDDLKGNGIVFYSEGRTYWSTFRPVLAALAARKTHVTYLTSDEGDPVFQSGWDEYVKARFIGKGNAAYTALGFLQADLFVLTTPGIDVLQIKRSAGVRKYIHLVHAIGDIHTYKFYSFDYYDAVYCAVPGQIKSLRALEASRQTKAKELRLLGCAYLDGLVERKQREGVRLEERTVLVAPTWGRNGLLSKTGARVPLQLEKAGYHVIVRPHPQSFISDKGVMQEVLEAIAGHEGIEVDRDPDGFKSLSRAAAMVSDISGVIFDYAFVFLRPVVSVGEGPIKDGYEAWELKHEAWEQGILSRIGEHVEAGEEDKLEAVLERVMKRRGEYEEAIREIRDETVENFGRAGEPIAQALLEEKAR